MCSVADCKNYCQTPAKRISSPEVNNKYTSVYKLMAPLSTEALTESSNKTFLPEFIVALLLLKSKPRTLSSRGMVLARLCLLRHLLTRRIRRLPASVAFLHSRPAALRFSHNVHQPSRHNNILAKRLHQVRGDASPASSESRRTRTGWGRSRWNQS